MQLISIMFVYDQETRRFVVSKCEDELWEEGYTQLNKAQLHRYTLMMKRLHDCYSEIPIANIESGIPWPDEQRLKGMMEVIENYGCMPKTATLYIPRRITKSMRYFTYSRVVNDDGCVSKGNDTWSLNLEDGTIKLFKEVLS